MMSISCQNPLCSEFNKEIYLNYCYNCKKGIVDSRETQRCPNGRYICPSCNSCCSNSSFNAIAQKYTLSGQTVPSKVANLMGTGHQDLNMYYCYRCGELMLLKEGGDPTNHENYYCPTCSNNQIYQ